MNELIEAIKKECDPPHDGSYYYSALYNSLDTSTTRREMLLVYVEHRHVEGDSAQELGNRLLNIMDDAGMLGIQ